MNPFSKFSSVSGKASTLIVVLFVIIVFVVGLRAGKIYFDNASMKSQLEEICERAILQNGYNLEEGVISTARGYGVILKPADFKYTFNDRKDQIRLSFVYFKTVDLYAFNRTLRFNMDISKELAKEKGVVDKFKQDAESGMKGATERVMEQTKSNPGQ